MQSAASNFPSAILFDISVQETTCGDFKAVVVEVAGRAFYTGVSRFVLEADDKLTHGFLLK